MSAISIRTRSAVPAVPFLTFLVLLLVVVSPLLVPRPHVLVPLIPAPVAPSAPVGQQDWGTVPLSFVPNVGLTDPSVAFQARGLGGTIFFTPQEVVLALPVAATGAPRPDFAAPDAGPAAGEGIPGAVGASAQVVRLQFDGANPGAVVRGGERQAGVVNSFIGNDPAMWRTNLPTYAGIVYEELYPGIELRYDGLDGQLMGAYTIAAGADPATMRWHYEGARALAVDAAGDLRLTIGAAVGSAAQDARAQPAAVLIARAPIAWQERNGVHIGVPVQYALHDGGGVSFALGDYDPTLVLEVTPALAYSTYLGGSATELGYGIAVDAAGNTFITGGTFSSGFPTRNALQSACSVDANGNCNGDAFVTKLDANGALVYSTYLGGSGYDEGQGIAVDGAGNAFITGLTISLNFPTRNAMQPACSVNANGFCSDAFVTKLDANGALAYSTYLGGSAKEVGYGIAVDAAGNAFITGWTGSPDFPTRNALQSACPVDVNGSCLDAFVTKLDANGALVYSTYLGGSGYDEGQGIAVDAAGNAFITGWTRSSDFPTRNALQPACSVSVHGHCDYDAFVTKIGGEQMESRRTFLPLLQR